MNLEVLKIPNGTKYARCVRLIEFGEVLTLKSRTVLLEVMLCPATWPLLGPLAAKVPVLCGCVYEWFSVVSRSVSLSNHFAICVPT